jgi:hypothetical protein
MKKLTLVAFSLFCSLAAMAQRNCGSMDNLNNQLLQDPTMQDRMEQIEQHTQNYAAHHQHGERAVITIPVVFHIIHNGDAVGSGENISDTYIMAQLDQLNKDYRKLNSDVSLVPSVFAGLAADAEIQFCLAQRKPDGTATTGINRVNMGQASWAQTQIESTLKPQTIWDRNKYLNVWSCIFGGSSASLLGYAQFPGGTANTDGVICTYTSFGSVATPNPAGGVYGKGRTLTHEVGHWLNLRHIWGDASCGNDQVSDTPTQQTSNYGCPSHPHVTCSNVNGDMFMNYMDYVDDGCMYMFSNGQKTRMQALFASGGSRVSLATSDGCTAPSGGGTTCGSPASLAAGSLTASGATLSWTAASGATSYNVQYKVSTASTWTTVSASSNSLSLTGLSASTTYSWQVQAVCSSGTSAYVAGSNFTTSASGGGGTCTDTYESNNSKSTAKTMAKNADITASIGTSTDVDWFKFTTTTADPKVKINLSNLAGDYDVKLYRSNTQVGISQNDGTLAEQIIYNGTTSAYTYYVYVYGYGGAFSASQCYTLRASTGATNFKTMEMEVAPNEISTLSLFPNPSKDKVTIGFVATANDNVIVRIFDVMGRQISQQNAATNEGANNIGVDVSQLANGYYFVQVDNGTMKQQGRFVVAH